MHIKFKKSYLEVLEKDLTHERPMGSPSTLGKMAMYRELLDHIAVILF